MMKKFLAGVSIYFVVLLLICFCCVTSLRGQTADDSIIKNWPVYDDHAGGIIAIFRNPGNFESWIEHVELVLSLDYIAGARIRLDWRSLEPEEGKFNWKLFDKPLEIACRKNKFIAIAIRVVYPAPKWVKNQVTNITFVHSHPAVSTVTTPSAFDPVYVRKLENLIRAVGQRYNGHPSVGCVTINGPASLFGVETNWPLKSISESEKARLGYTHEKFIAGWKKMIDVFLEAFPDTKLTLGLHHNIRLGGGGLKKSVQVVEEIRDYALKKAPDGHIGLKLLGMLNIPGYFDKPYSPDEKVNDYIKLVWDVREKADIVSFEAGQIFSRTNAWRRGKPPYSREDVMYTVKNGISYKPKFIEIFCQDLICTKTNKIYEPYVPAMEYAKKVLDGK